MNSVHIENWSIIRYCMEPAPGDNHLLLTGEPIDHTNEYLNGHLVTTSTIQEIDETGVTTINTKYLLGKMNPHFKKYLKTKGLKIEDFYTTTKTYTYDNYVR